MRFGYRHIGPKLYMRGRSPNHNVGAKDFMARIRTVYDLKDVLTSVCSVLQQERQMKL